MWHFLEALALVFEHYSRHPSTDSIDVVSVKNECDIFFIIFEHKLINHAEHD